MNKIVVIVLLTLSLSGCVTTPKIPQQLMSASFYNIQKNSFSLRAMAPEQMIREYAICKAIWFAEKRKVTKLSLSNPKYNNKANTPEGWVTVEATAYLTKAKSTKNPFVNVADMAVTCRSGWEWYR